MPTTRTIWLGGYVLETGVAIVVAPDAAAVFRRTGVKIVEKGTQKPGSSPPRAVCKGAATVETLLPVRQPALAKAASSLSLWQRTAGLDSRGPARMRTERVHTVRDR